MRVLLDTTYARLGPSGTGVYLDEIARALRSEGVEIVEAANERRPAPAGGGSASVRNLALDAWWTQAELPRRARAAGADVLHHPLPALARRASCPQVVTVHDLAFERLPDHFSPAFRRWASLTHRRSARGARAVICVSETTRLDALARWGVDPARIVVAPHGPGQAPHITPVAPRHFLYVGDDEPRKNLGPLLTAYACYRAAPGRPRSSSCSPGVNAAARATPPLRACAAISILTCRRCWPRRPRSSIHRCTRASG